MNPTEPPDDRRLAGEVALQDLHDRTDGELLLHLAGAADQRRAEASGTEGPTEDDHRITDLEDALVSELRSRRVPR